MTLLKFQNLGLRDLAVLLGTLLQSCKLALDYRMTSAGREHLSASIKAPGS